MSNYNNKFIKTSFKNGEIPEVVFILGNGVIENGWEPYRHHLQEVKKLKDKEINKNLDLSIFLARHAFLIRLAHEHVKNKIYDVMLNPNKGVEGIEGETDGLVRLYGITNKISKKYAEPFNYDCRLRNKDNEVLNKCREIANNRKFGVITTNWDLLLFNDEFWGENIIQLHGRADVDNSIILPTQFAIDSLNDSKFVNFVKKMGVRKCVVDKDFHPPYSSMELDELLNRCFRDSKISQVLYDAQITAQKWLSESHEIVTAGVAFNTYDSELLSILPIREIDRNIQLRKLTVFIKAKSKEDKEDKEDRRNIEKIKSSFGLLVEEKGVMVIPKNVY